MSNFTVYGISMSTCTRRVLTALAEKDVTDFKFVNVDLFKGEHKTPEYLEKHHPFGQIPVFYDGDFKIFESRAIVRYIDDVVHTGTTLIPKDAKHKGLVEQWISIEMSDYKADQVVIELFFKPMRGGKPDPAALEAAAKKLHETFEVMEKTLTGRKFLVGDSFTAADLVFMPFTEYLLQCEGYGNVLDKYPNVKAWWANISSRPSWKKVTGK